QLPMVDGVMIGRAAYANPYLLASLQAKYFKNKPILSRHEVVYHLLPYIRDQLKNKVKLHAITRHILGLFQGQRGAAAWRRYLSQHACQSGAGAEVLEQALALISNE
ncbi:MAG: tRNA dihydrouridine(20/20a) synthase DusA, partial [Gammaproteobacteria bacterium]